MVINNKFDMQMIIKKNVNFDLYDNFEKWNNYT